MINVKRYRKRVRKRERIRKSREREIEIKKQTMDRKSCVGKVRKRKKETKKSF